ncbi:hypothetical protein OBBRIDRAFT_890044 [Obba rivulosa]|uniref:Uncharacterized protein n=1 Tax=Obba rivulosa TaxID=1052685 RepID=A0A8E2ARJ3_9APHY|nr:hypothetical protein OBBRIDRAFT_890044 [Obba rivulosa]
MENVAPADGDRDKSPRSLPTLDYLLQSSSRGTKRSTRTSSLMTAARTLSRTQSASSSTGDIGLPTPPASQQDVLADPSRTLMSPPPEEILRVTGRTSTSRARSIPLSITQITTTPSILEHTVSSPGSTSTTAKRKRAGAPRASRPAYSDFDATAEGRHAIGAIDEAEGAVEKTPNPKPRKQTKRSAASRGSPTHRDPLALEPSTPTRSSRRQSGSPSKRTLFLSPHADNPRADYVPSSVGRSRRRSVTPAVPYEPPPPDRFTPPREVLYTPPTAMSKSSKRKTASRVKTEKPRLVLSIKKEPPVIDLTSPPPPGSPTDDPLLLAGSPARRRPRDRTSLYARDTPMRSSTPPIPAPDLASSRVLDEEADTHMQSFDASLDDDAIVPVFRFDDVPDDAGAGAWTDDEDDDTAGGDGFNHSGEYTGKFKVLTVPTKQDPPSPTTKQRMDAWGRPISPFPWPRELPPSAGPSIEIPQGQDSATQPPLEQLPSNDIHESVLDLTVPAAPLLDDVAVHVPSLSSPDHIATQHSAHPPSPLQHTVSAENTNVGIAEDGMHESAADTTDIPEPATDHSGQDQARLDHGSSVRSDWRNRAPLHSARDNPMHGNMVASVSIRDKIASVEQLQGDIVMRDAPLSTDQIPRSTTDAGTRGPLTFLRRPHTEYNARLPLSEAAQNPAETDRASDDDSDEATVDRELSREPEPDDEPNAAPDLRGLEALLRPEHGATRDVNTMESDNETTLPVGTSMEADEDSDDSEVLDDGVIKIVSDDPRAAARAAAILKMHDYDCIPHILLRKKRHSHSSAQSVAKSSRRKSASDAGIRKRVPDVRRRRTIGGLVGDTVVVPDGPALTLPELLQEAERDLARNGSFTAATPVKADPSPPRLAPEPPQAQSFALRVLGPRDWLKDDWKLLDACFTDERMAVATAQGRTADDLADVDDVSLAHVIERFVEGIGGDANLATLCWTREDLRRRAEALQSKQRSGKVAPPTPRMQSPWSVRASAPPVTPLPRAFPEATTYTRSWSSFDADSFRRRESVPSSLLAPRYSHLMEEALAVSSMETPSRPDPPATHPPATNPPTTDTSATESPMTTLSPPPTSLDIEHRPAAQSTPTSDNRSIAGRVKGFFSSYIPTLSRSTRAKTMPAPSQPGLPIPPREIFERPRVPVVTPAAKPAPKAVPPKDLVQLHSVPAAKPAAPARKSRQPHRLVELRAAAASAPAGAVPVPRERRASGGSVKDLVRTFEDMRRLSEGAERGLRRTKSITESRAGGSTRQRPVWRP